MIRCKEIIEENGFHFKNYKYNIIPLNFPGPSEAIVELPEVLHLSLMTIFLFFVKIVINFNFSYPEMM